MPTAHARINPLILLPSVVLIIALIHLSFEHFSGGVRSHHLLNRPDLPAISNWFGLITLPLLGVALGLQVRRRSSSPGWLGISSAVLSRLLGALLYGAFLALSFEFGISSVTGIAFSGLFVCALLLPVYRAEYMLGFVIGMTFTFGAVLPFFVASIVATFSLLTRSAIGVLVTIVRRKKSNNATCRK